MLAEAGPVLPRGIMEGGPTEGPQVLRPRETLELKSQAGGSSVWSCHLTAAQIPRGQTVWVGTRPCEALGSNRELSGVL